MIVSTASSVKLIGQTSIPPSRLSSDVPSEAVSSASGNVVSLALFSVPLVEALHTFSLNYVYPFSPQDCEFLKGKS